MIVLKTIKRAIKEVFEEKEKIKSSTFIFYPYYELDVNTRTYESVKESIFGSGGIIRKEERIVDATVLFDAITGELCSYDPKIGITGIIRIPELSEEETKTFQILMQEAITASGLASLLNCSTAKARKILQGLATKGIVEVYSFQRQVLYDLKIEIPNLLSMNSIPLNLH